MRINYINDNGQSKQLTRVAYGKRAAEILEIKLIDEIKIKGEKPMRKMTVQELFDEFITFKSTEVKRLTISKITDDFNFYILPTFKNLHIDKITTKMLLDWKMSQKSKRLALSTNASAFINFRAMIKYAVDMEYIFKNPFDKVKNFRDKSTVIKEMLFYTYKQFKKFIRKAKKFAKEKQKQLNDMSEWNYYVFFNIAFYTGLRKGEIHALKWSDIKGDCLSVKRSITQRLGDLETSPKNPTSIRTIQMPSPLVRILKKHKRRYQRLHNFSDDFRVCNGIRNNSIARRNRLYSKEAGLKTIRIHDYRHSHASVLANAGILINEVSRRLGHARIEMTWNCYSHLYEKEKERAVRVFNKVDFSCLHDLYTFPLKIIKTLMKSIVLAISKNVDK